MKIRKIPEIPGFSENVGKFRRNFADFRRKSWNFGEISRFSMEIHKNFNDPGIEVRKIFGPGNADSIGNQRKPLISLTFLRLEFF